MQRLPAGSSAQRGRPSSRVSSESLRSSMDHYAGGAGAEAAAAAPGGSFGLDMQRQRQPQPTADCIRNDAVWGLPVRPVGGEGCIREGYGSGAAAQYGTTVPPVAAARLLQRGYTLTPFQVPPALVRREEREAWPADDLDGQHLPQMVQSRSFLNLLSLVQQQQQLEASPCSGPSPPQWPLAVQQHDGLAQQQQQQQCSGLGWPANLASVRRAAGTLEPPSICMRMLSSLARADVPPPVPLPTFAARLTVGAESQHWGANASVDRTSMDESCCDSAQGVRDDCNGAGVLPLADAATALAREEGRGSVSERPGGAPPAAGVMPVLSSRSSHSRLPPMDDVEEDDDMDWRQVPFEPGLFKGWGGPQ